MECLRISFPAQIVWFLSVDSLESSLFLIVFNFDALCGHCVISLLLIY